MLVALERLRTRRPRAALAIASLFAIWHTTALLIAPAPESRLQGVVYPIFRPYLALLHLDAGWGFFAPDPHPGVRMLYVVTGTLNWAGFERRSLKAFKLRRLRWMFYYAKIVWPLLLQASIRYGLKHYEITSATLVINDTDKQRAK